MPSTDCLESQGGLPPAAAALPGEPGRPLTCGGSTCARSANSCSWWRCSSPSRSLPKHMGTPAQRSAAQNRTGSRPPARRRLRGCQRMARAQGVRAAPANDWPCGDMLEQRAQRVKGAGAPCSLATRSDSRPRSTRSPTCAEIRTGRRWPRAAPRRPLAAGRHRRATTPSAASGILRTAKYMHSFPRSRTASKARKALPSTRLVDELLLHAGAPASSAARRGRSSGRSTSHSVTGSAQRRPCAISRSRVCAMT